MHDWQALYNQLTPHNRTRMTDLIRKSTESLMYQYLTVPFMGSTKGDKLTPENIASVGQQLQDAINQHAQAGWEFCSLDTVSFSQSPGCMASVFGGKPTVLNFDYLIFRRPV